MATAAQFIANQANAKFSTGPVTPEGKARASQNAATLGLFSASAFIRLDEREVFEAFRDGWTARLVPDGPVEEALVTELVHAAWRLHRCALLEETTPAEATTAEDLDRMQASIDRARVAAQRALQRNLNELRRLQTDRRMRDLVPYGYEAHAKFGVASIKDFDEFMREVTKRHSPAAVRMSPAVHRGQISEQTQSATPESDSAEQTQSESPSIPRSAPCPCGSGIKYKRCCGKDAPPVLSRAA